MSYVLSQAIKNQICIKGWNFEFGWCGWFNTATLEQQFVAVFLHLVAQTPRCGGSWGLFHNTGLLSQPSLKISMKWSSQLEFIMKDRPVWLQDIHENQYPNLIWQMIPNINRVDTFLPIPVKYIISQCFPYICCVNGRAMHSGSGIVGSRSNAAHWPLHVCMKLRSGLFYSNFRSQTSLATSQNFQTFGTN